MDCRKKKWIIAFFFFEGITLIIWGVSKRFIPGKKVEHVEKTGAKELGDRIFFSLFFCHTEING